MFPRRKPAAALHAVGGSGHRRAERLFQLVGGANVLDGGNALSQQIDESPNDFGSLDDGAAARADVGGETIEKNDLAVEQDDGDFRPVFLPKGAIRSERAVAGPRAFVIEASHDPFLLPERPKPEFRNSAMKFFLRGLPPLFNCTITVDGSFDPCPDIGRGRAGCEKIAAAPRNLAMRDRRNTIGTPLFAALRGIRDFHRKAPRAFLAVGSLLVLLPALFGVALNLRSLRRLSDLTEQVLRQRMRLVLRQVDAGSDDDTLDLVNAIRRFDVRAAEAADRPRIAERLRRVWDEAHGLPTEVFYLRLSRQGEAESLLAWRPVDITADFSPYQAAILASWRNFRDNGDLKAQPEFLKIVPAREGPVTLAMLAAPDEPPGAVVGAVIDPRLASLEYFRGLVSRRIAKPELQDLTLGLWNPMGGATALPRFGGEPPGAPAVRQRLRTGMLPTSWSLGVQTRGGTVRETADRVRRRYRLLLVAAGALFLINGALLVGALRSDIRSLALKSGTLASLSHELKTPISLIRVSADTLRLRRYSNPELHERYCGYILEESSRLSAIVERILGIARGDQDPEAYRFAPADLGRIAREAVAAYDLPIQQRNARVSLEIEPALPTVPGDEPMLRQAIQNLLDNALKFSPDPPEIRLTVERRNGVIAISLSDTGPGIPQAEIERIFEPFVRLSGTQSAPGHGLGLTLVRQVARAHGGSVRVEASSAGGAVFRMELPVTAPPPASVAGGNA
jgi:signal transduction histidine kinase